MTIPVSASRAIQRHPAYDLLCRYRAILGAAWAHRAELAGPKRLADEAALFARRPEPARHARAPGTAALCLWHRCPVRQCARTAQRQPV